MKYQVRLVYTNVYLVDVEAENEEQAKNLAHDTFSLAHDVNEFFHYSALEDIEIAK